MQVVAKFKVGTTVRTVILADHGKTAPKNFKLDGKRAIEVTELFRAAEVKVYDRGNQSTEITFETAVVDDDNFAQNAEFFMFYGAVVGNLMGSADVVFNSFNVSTGTANSWTLPNAVVHGFGGTYIGDTLFRFFRITGGSIRSTQIH